jgi:UDP-4-amino-4-deoxy-L-arabinose-oxoglutarate aminotransferase
MTLPFLPVARPSINDADVEAVTEVLRSGWITTGAKCARFEEEFAAYVGAAGGVAVTSATAGLQLVLHALGIGPGDEVITPSMTWVSTVNLIVLCGATPVFADVDRDTLLVQPDEIERLCTDRTKLIIPVHFAGAPVDLDPIREIADARGIRVVEDAAHAVGTKYRGRPIGSTGTTIFSFHPIKNMTTAEGGMICSDDTALLDQVRQLRFHGLGVDAFDRKTQGRTPQAEVLQPGFKCNLPDMCAALGLSQLARVDAMNAQRARLAERYGRALKDHPLLHPLGDPEHPFVRSWHLYPVRLDTDAAGLTRNDFMEQLKQLGIGTGIHFQAVHRQKYYFEDSGLPRAVLPDTEWNSERICSLPLFADMTEADVDRVLQGIEAVLSPLCGDVSGERAK